MESIQDKYISDNSFDLPEVLEWLERETHIRTNHGRMISGPVLGRFLISFSRMVAPGRVLEIGTFTGYSAICLAQGLRNGGIIDVIEINDELVSLITEGFKRAGIASSVALHIGDASGIIPELPEESFDLVYIDANKREYVKYYELVFDKVRRGGYIIADNVLWSGKVYGDPIPKDAQTMGIYNFNAMVKKDHRVESYILPLRDGINIIKKL